MRCNSDVSSRSAGLGRGCGAVAVGDRAVGRGGSGWGGGGLLQRGACVARSAFCAATVFHRLLSRFCAAGNGERRVGWYSSQSSGCINFVRPCTSSCKSMLLRMGITVSTPCSCFSRPIRGPLMKPRSTRGADGLRLNCSKAGCGQRKHPVVYMALVTEGGAEAKSRIWERRTPRGAEPDVGGVWRGVNGARLRWAAARFAAILLDGDGAWPKSGDLGDGSSQVPPGKGGDSVLAPGAANIFCPGGDDALH